MSFPPVTRKAYAALGGYTFFPTQPPGTSGRTPSRFSGLDFVDTTAGLTPPIVQTYQQPFYGSVWMFPEYPDEILSPLVGGGYFPFIGLADPYVTLTAKTQTKEWDWKYPKDYVDEYNPTPPPDGPGDPIPDPNGVVGTASGSGPGVMSTGFFPHWHTEASYDWGTSLVGWPPGAQDVPDPSVTYTIEMPVAPHALYFPWSVDFTVNNYDSRVLNDETSEYEFYPYTQATFEVKNTAEVVIDFNTNLGGSSPHDMCCWLEGCTIKGKVAFANIDATLEAVSLGYDETHGDYGFGGMTFQPDGSPEATTEEEWEVVYSSSFTPVKIEIPRTAGKITFLNDFWITEVIPPS